VQAAEREPEYPAARDEREGGGQARS